VVGEPYQYTLLATGGLPPYIYHAASLPPGFTLSPAGVLAVTPGNLPLIGVFTASVRDHRGCSAQQTYRLAIVAPPQPPSPVQPKPPTPTPAPKPIPKPKPVPPAPLSTVPLEDTLAEPATPQPSMDTYVLTQEIFEDKELLAELKLMSANAATAGSMAPADEPAAASTAPTSNGQTSTSHR
jgi:outer membrane biosynthesis protein TonB